MATSTRVQLLSDGSEGISVLKEFLSNPSLIDNLQEEVKKLNSLTEEEESKLQDAKLTIQSHQQKTKELQDLQDKITSDRAAHEQDILSKTKDFNDYVASENQKLAEANADLDSKKLAHEEEELRLKQYDNKLKETAAKIKGLAGE